MSDVQSTFQLSGLHCESCKKITEKRVSKIEGVIQANTNLDSGEIRITAKRAIAPSEVIKALEGTDYQVK